MHFYNTEFNRHEISGVFRISVRRGRGARRRGGGVWWGLATPKKSVFPKVLSLGEFNAAFNMQKTRTVARSLGHDKFYVSIAKQSLQKQFKNYPKIHGQTKGVDPS